MLLARSFRFLLLSSLVLSCVQFSRGDDYDYDDWFKTDDSNDDDVFEDNDESVVLNTDKPQPSPTTFCPWPPCYNDGEKLNFEDLLKNTDPPSSSSQAPDAASPISASEDIEDPQINEAVQR